MRLILHNSLIIATRLAAFTRLGSFHKTCKDANILAVAVNTSWQGEQAWSRDLSLKLSLRVAVLLRYLLQRAKVEVQEESCQVPLKSPSRGGRRSK